MHAIDVSPGPISVTGITPSAPHPYLPNVTFVPGLNGSGEQRIGPLVAERTARRELFYGIEVMAAGAGGKPIQLDFNRFLPILPTFVSVVWLGLRYWEVEPVESVESLRLCQKLGERIPVMPHLSAFRLPQKRLDQLLALNFTSLLVVRGDLVLEDQDFTTSLPMVERSKLMRGDKISVCVAGYPEGYTNRGDTPQDFSRNMECLKAKVAAGADCIITQMCYQSEAIIQFVRDCRAAGITVPIVVGLMVHESFRSYKIVERITNIQMSRELSEELNQLRSRKKSESGSASSATLEFFVSHTVQIIRDILDADVGVWGVHFFTMNRFHPVQEVLQELRELDLLKEAFDNGNQPPEV
ncbi:hypothetical protein KR009_006505 [Drosophila setifemur]|nr:hypothetical protein KR009_006505 [Drosophila setifemur]